MREFELIDRIRKANPGLGASVLVPPGDDLGMIQLPEGGAVLAGVDQVVAGIHLAVDASPIAYGRKVMNRSLSDVAAMACVPVGAVVSAVLPSELMSDPDWAARFADAAREAASRFGVPLFGGDVATLSGRPGPFSASATVLAVPDAGSGGRVVLRSGATPGDQVFVSGCFGRSLAADGGGHHLDFIPRIELARRLHAELGSELTSMIDVSDGLAADAGHLCSESGVGMLLDADRVPRRDGAGAVEAFSNGEDYELCFTVRSGRDLPKILEDVMLTRIGEVVAGAGPEIIEDGRPLELDRTGWEHQG